MMKALTHGTLIFSLLYTCIAQGLEITRVNHDPKIFIPKNNETVNIEFTVSTDSVVTVKIFDEQDLLIRKISTGNLHAGHHAVQWDGKDQAGRLVPPEAYKYTILANNGSVNTEHDLSDHTGIEQFIVEDVQWDHSKNQLTYQLNKPSRVFIRIGLKNYGPLMASVINWVPRASGAQTESWDGLDASGVLELSKHPELLIDAQAYTLTKNTILVGPLSNLRSTRKNFVESYPWGKESRSIKHKRKRHIIAPYQQRPELRGDYLVQLKLPDDLPKTKDDLPIITGVVPVLLEVDASHSEFVLNRRSEPVFFVDGQFVFENEVGFLPMTWKLDTSTMIEGEHYLTVNLRGYEGNFGLATTKVYVKH